MTSLSDSAFNRAVGQRLALARRRLGLSQPALARSLGVSRRAIENYEQGTREISAVVVARLVRRHGVDANWLLLGDAAAPAGAPDEPAG